MDSQATTPPNTSRQPALTTGKVWKYSDNVNTDVIFPGRYTYTLKTPDEIGAHALEDLDPEFTRQARAGDVIVAGRNWGNGSSREQAVTCLKYRGIAAVVAPTFARIYYRNGINQGLALIACPQIVRAARTDDRIALNLAESYLVLNGEVYPFEPFSQTALDLLAIGGLIPYVKKILAQADSQEGDGHV